MDIIEGFENGTFSIDPNNKNISEQTDTVEEKTDTDEPKSDKKRKD